MNLTETDVNLSLARRGSYPNRLNAPRTRRKPSAEATKTEKVDNVDVFRPVATFWFALAHVPLAVAMYRIDFLSTLHGALTIFWCLYITLTTRRAETIAVAMSYLIGAEILWRSTNARVPYEAGKYFIVIMTLLLLTRERRMRIPWPPIVYLFLLLPSVMLTLTESLKTADGKSLYGLVAFNLSGPLALACSVIFCSRLRLSGANLLNIFAALTAPAIGASTLTMYVLRTSEKVHFGRSSVSVIREEFGPNQLSAAMGLGALLLVMMLLLDMRATLMRRMVMGAGTLMLLSAVGLSFSRGGFYNFGGALIAGLFVVMRDAQSRLRLTLIIAASILVGGYIVVPALDNYTQGGLLLRFQSTNLTGRDKIAWDDLHIWQENPIYGVGPGRATSYRIALGQTNQAHTEFTRLLAEHGLLGFGSLLALFFMAGRNIFSKTDPRSRAIAVSLVVWSFLYMTNAAMRLSAPSFIFGLASAWFNLQETKPPALTAQPKIKRKRALLAPQSALRSA